MQRVWSTYLAPSTNNSHRHSQEVFLTPGSANDPLHRRTSSAMSHTSSLSSPQRNSNTILEPPIASFTGRAPSASPAGSPRTRTVSGGSTTANSLSINYLPTKFSRPLPPGGLQKRKGRNGKVKTNLPKRGGGREAFKIGESRMPEEKDEDYDGVDINHGTWKSKLRWNRFKWILFCTNLVVSVYSLITLIFCILTWLNVWTHSDVVRVGNRTLLILSTVASTVGIVTSLLGWAGILLNNRAFLATYTLLLWVTFALIAAPGYLSYKTRTFNLEGKVNAQWSRDLGVMGRLRIQNQLDCCGYYSPFVEATASQLCYSRSVLPGCKNPYLKFERTTLERWYGVAFGLVPFHLSAILAALLCSNHITYRFGKGMTPKSYRLNMTSMSALMDQYANQLTEEFGAGVASKFLSRSQSNLHLGSVPSLHYGTGSNSDSDIKTT